MYLSSSPCSEPLLTYRFTGAIQHNFVLKFHPTFPAHYPPTSPKLPPYFVPTSPIVLPHYFPTFPTLPPHSTYTPFPPSQLTTLPPFPAHLPPTDKQMSPRWQRSFTRQTGQTRVTNNQAATHESWLVRSSPHAPGFSRSNQPNQAYSASHPVFSCSKSTIEALDQSVKPLQS